MSSKSICLGILLVWKPSARAHSEVLVTGLLFFFSFPQDLVAKGATLVQLPSRKPFSSQAVPRPSTCRSSARSPAQRLGWHGSSTRHRLSSASWHCKGRQTKEQPVLNPQKIRITFWYEWLLWRSFWTKSLTCWKERIQGSQFPIKEFVRLTKLIDIAGAIILYRVWSKEVTEDSPFP